jgi:NodT family efflux transporter outer membrane factor (OMF) lipoprotein
MKSRRLFLLLTMAAAGCAGLQPVEREPNPVTTPDNWTASSKVAVAVDTSASPILDIGFDDPGLAAVVSEALEANNDLRAAAARVERARAQAVIAGADLYPQASVSLDGARRKQNFIGLPIPGAEDEILSNTSTTYGLGLNVSWEIDLWGRLRNQKGAAAADLEAATADYDFARLSIAAQTAKVWFAMNEAKRQVELATATRDNFRRSAERIARRYREGLSSSVELRLARTNAAAAEALVEQRKQQLDAVTRQLEAILGRYPSGRLEAGEALPSVDRAIPIGMPADLVARRPDLRSAERRLAATDARVASARASLYPQFRLTGSAGTSSNELEDLLDGDFSVWSFAAGLLQPLFQGGRLRANVDLNEAIADEQAAAFVQRVLNAYAEVETALVAEQALVRQEEALRVAAENAVAARDSAEDRYMAGVGDYIVVLTSQRDAFDAESRLLAIRRQRLTSRIDLILALGGGFADEVDLGGEGMN